MPRARSPVALVALLPVILAAARVAAGAEAIAPAGAATAAPTLRITYPAGRHAVPSRERRADLRVDTTRRAASIDGTSWSATTPAADVVTASVDAPRWRPSEDDWARIKQRSAERDAELVVAGVDRTNPATTLSSSRVHIRTSKDPVGDSLFYREVPLPFLTAVQDPSRIRWRLRDHRHARRSTDRAAEPARVRELSLLRGQRQRARAGRRLRQRQGRLRHHAGVEAHGDGRREDHDVVGLQARRTASSPSGCCRGCPRPDAT